LRCLLGILHKRDVLGPVVKDLLEDSIASLRVEVLEEGCSDGVLDDNRFIVTVIGHVLEDRQEHERAIDVLLEDLGDVLNQLGPLGVDVDREVSEGRREHVQDELRCGLV